MTYWSETFKKHTFIYSNTFLTIDLCSQYTKLRIGHGCAAINHHTDKYPHETISFIYHDLRARTT